MALSKAVVKKQSIKETIKLLEKGYRKEQLRFLKGNKEQLVNELFCGSNLVGKKYKCLKINEIKEIIFKDVNHTEDFMVVICHFKTKDNQIYEIELNLRSKKNGKFVLVGGLG